MDCLNFLHIAGCALISCTVSYWVNNLSCAIFDLFFNAFDVLLNFFAVKPELIIMFARDDCVEAVDECGQWERDTVLEVQVLAIASVSSIGGKNMTGGHKQRRSEKLHQWKFLVCLDFTFYSYFLCPYC